jgi:hypothetical protein
MTLPYCSFVSGAVRLSARPDQHDGQSRIHLDTVSTMLSTRHTCSTASRGRNSMLLSSSECSTAGADRV